MKVDSVSKFNTIFRNFDSHFKNSAKFGISMSRPLTNDVFVKNTSKTDNQVSFGSYLSTENFQIKSIPNLHCPICDQLMMSNEQTQEFARNVSPCMGQDLVNALDKYGDEYYWTQNPASKGKSIYKPKRQQIVDRIKVIALEHPEMNLVQIVQYEAKNCIDKLIQTQSPILNEIDNYRCQNNSEEKLLLKEITDKYREQILGLSDKQFKRKSVINEISKRVKDDKTREDVLKIASKFPDSKTDINSFFVKYSKGDRKSFEIARNLVSVNVATAEHIVPQSLGGKSSLSNYLCDCANCNSSRGNEEFDVWIENLNDPEIESRFQRHINVVKKLYETSCISGDYINYARDLALNLNMLSNNKLNLEKPKNITLKEASELKGVYNAKAKRLEELANRMNELSEQIVGKGNSRESKELAKEYSELDIEYFMLTIQVEKLRQAILASLPIDD